MKRTGLQLTFIPMESLSSGIQFFSTCSDVKRNIMVIKLGFKVSCMFDEPRVAGGADVQVGTTNVQSVE